MLRKWHYLKGLGSMTLFEEVRHWGVEVSKAHTGPIDCLPPACGSRCRTLSYRVWLCAAMLFTMRMT